MAMITDDQARESGLVWFDADAAVGASTHVLIAGVGRFDDKADVGAVSSPPNSARRMAEWFVNGATERGPGFANPVRPLASLAMLLSETPDGSPSEFEGGPVPRATFAALKNAVRAWITRATANPANSMILFLASHGISAGRRTALLCEDYGSDPLDATAGMTEVDQFVFAVRQLDVAGKLLIFDCCRNEDDTFNPIETLGERLIGPIRGAGIQQEPTVLCSTILGKKAFGERGGPTLFTKALLQALDGLAATPYANWRIGSFTLSTVTSQLLALNERKGAKIQVPQVQLSEDFPIAVTRPTDRVALFLSVEPPWSKDGWVIQIEDANGKVSNWGPAEQGARHTRVELPAGVLHGIRLQDVDGKIRAQYEAILSPPVAFQSIPDPYSLVVERKKTALRADGSNFPAKISFSGEAGIARVGPIDLDGRPRVGGALVTSEGGMSVTLPQMAPESRAQLSNLEVGTYRVEIVRPDGLRIQKSVEISAGDAVEVKVPSVSSPHKLLHDAVLAGVVPPATDTLAVEPSRPPPTLSFIASPFSSESSAPNLRAVEGMRDGRFVLIDIDDDEDKRYFLAASQSAHNPPWVVAEGDGWREYAFVPTLGMHGALELGWRAAVLIDAEAQQGSHLRTFVRAPEWTPLLAFLGRRDFASSAVALQTLGGSVREAVLEKRRNPLAACAGALTAIACGPLEDFDLPPEWLENLANWFPGLPDGLVAQGRHLQRQGDTEAAQNAYLAAEKRGVPVYSLAVDWLAEGLLALDPDNAAGAQRWSWQNDPASTFTVLRDATGHE